MSERTFKQRRRGTLGCATDGLRERYNRATAGSRRAFERSDLDVLFQATGDPLVLQDRAKAVVVYGLANPARPSAVLRKIRAEAWGDELSSITDIARQFQARGWSALRAAGEAVALAAERGCWIGLNAAVSFDHAVDQVRKALLKARRQSPGLCQPPGWTGNFLFVRPAPGRLVSVPAAARTRLPAQGMEVRDDAYWRRRIQDGDAIVMVDEEKNTQR